MFTKSSTNCRDKITDSPSQLAFTLFDEEDLPRRLKKAPLFDFSSLKYNTRLFTETILYTSTYFIKVKLSSI